MIPRHVPIEERIALEDLLTAYCLAVDKLGDVDGLLSLFTPDAVLDLSGIHLPKVEGHAGIRSFFEPVFGFMTHHAHFVSNFQVDRLDGDHASTSAYVMGMGVSSDGNSVTVYVKYFLDCVRFAGRWKIKKFYETALMPLPKSLTDIHAKD